MTHYTLLIILKKCFETIRFSVQLYLMFFPLLFLLIQWQLSGLGVILRLYFTLFCYLLHWVRLTWIDINIIYALLTHVISRARSGILIWYPICLDDVPCLVWIRCWAMLHKSMNHLSWICGCVWCRDVILSLLSWQMH